MHGIGFRAQICSSLLIAGGRNWMHWMKGFPFHIPTLLDEHNMHARKIIFYVPIIIIMGVYYEYGVGNNKNGKLLPIGKNLNCIFSRSRSWPSFCAQLHAKKSLSLFILYKLCLKLLYFVFDRSNRQLMWHNFFFSKHTNADPCRTSSVRWMKNSWLGVNRNGEKTYRIDARHIAISSHRSRDDIRNANVVNDECPPPAIPSNWR